VIHGPAPEPEPEPDHPLIVAVAAAVTDCAAVDALASRSPPAGGPTVWLGMRGQLSSSQVESGVIRGPVPEPEPEPDHPLKVAVAVAD